MAIPAKEQQQTYYDRIIDLRRRLQGHLRQSRTCHPLVGNYKDIWRYHCNQYQQEMNRLAQKPNPSAAK